MGSELRLVSRRDQGRWLCVDAPDGYRGWARSWGVVEIDPSLPKSCVYVSAPFATIRERPSATSPVVSQLTMGCRLHLFDKKRSGWRRVATPDGRRGWIAAASTRSDAIPASGRFWSVAPRGGPVPQEADFARASLRSVLERARILLGVAYRWGGVSPMGIDCSGFVRLIAGLEGIPLPRDTGDQAAAVSAWWTDEDPGRLKAGDIVFFGASAESIDHVGFGTGGRSGRFIHASGRVRISSLSHGDTLFERHLARRAVVIARPGWGR